MKCNDTSTICIKSNNLKTKTQRKINPVKPELLIILISSAHVLFLLICIVLVNFNSVSSFSPLMHSSCSNCFRVYAKFDLSGHMMMPSCQLTLEKLLHTTICRLLRLHLQCSFSANICQCMEYTTEISAWPNRLGRAPSYFTAHDFEGPGV